MRQNKPVVLEPVEVVVFAFELLVARRLPMRGFASTARRAPTSGASLTISGRRLGVGAHLCNLRRTASGSFRIDQAQTLERLAEVAQDGDLVQALIPAAELLPEFPTETVDPTTANFIRQGRDFRTSPFRAPEFKSIREGHYRGRPAGGHRRGEAAQRLSPGPGSLD